MGKWLETQRKQQEEGFAGGLPARNARMFRHEPAPAVGILLSWGMAVDNLWITMGFIHNRREWCFPGRGGVCRRSGYPTIAGVPFAPYASIAGHWRGFAGRRKPTANDRRRKAPGVSTRGLVG